MGPHPTGLESLKQHQHTQGRLCEDTGRREPSTNQGEASGGTGPAHTGISDSSLQDWETVLFKAPTVRHSLRQPRRPNNVAQSMLGVSDRPERWEIYEPRKGGDPTRVNIQQDQV